MSVEEEIDVNAIVDLGELLINQVLERKPLDELRDTIKHGAPLWYQNEEGLSALHAAAYNEDEELVQLLLEKGAVWNAVDGLGNSAGDVSLSLNNEQCYRLIRDAGLRSEYLLSHLSSHSVDVESPSTLVLRNEDTSASASSAQFLKSKLSYKVDNNGQHVCLLRDGADEVGVMMGWEREIMRQTVSRLCKGFDDENGLKILNVGFGLGIIDTFFQEADPPPVHHFIIEAHPDVLNFMKLQGWYDKKGVTILEGKWQDILKGDKIYSIGGFDIIYTDTFSEYYEELHDFFEHVPDLLTGPDARFSFFNGLGATNALFYDVYTQLADLHLGDTGLVVEWSDIDVDGGQGEDDKWLGTRNYFGMKLYRLPIARMKI